jgi:hypothetical protein
MADETVMRNANPAIKRNILRMKSPPGPRINDG